MLKRVCRSKVETVSLWANASKLIYSFNVSTFFSERNFKMEGGVHTLFCTDHLSVAEIICRSELGSPSVRLFEWKSFYISGILRKLSHTQVMFLLIALGSFFPGLESLQSLMMVLFPAPLSPIIFLKLYFLICHNKSWIFGGYWVT